MTWNATSLDMNRQKPEMTDPASSGLTRNAPNSAFRLPGAIRWNFNVTSERSGAGGMRAVGDPRANFTVTYDWASFNNFSSCRWQGRQSDSSTTARQNFSTLWAARDFIRQDANLGTALTSDGSDPESVSKTWAVTDGDNAPAFLRNGLMVSVGELGHIFDPAQVDDSGLAPSVGSPANSLGCVGGRTLRIGQPESQYWATNGGLLAMRLLDLFTVNPIGTNAISAIPTNTSASLRGDWSNRIITNPSYANMPVMFGRINVNTAPPEVLSAVLSGVAINSDIGAGSGSPSQAGPAGALVTALITNRPYGRISDLHKALSAFVDAANFTWTGSPIANITATNLGNPFPAMATMDRSREELFARTVNLFSTQSRAFRVYVIGQALGKRTNPVSLLALEASVLLEPSGNTNGFTVMQPSVVFKKTQ